MAVRHYYLSSSGIGADVSAFGIHSLEKPGEKTDTQFFRSGQAYATAEIEYRADGREGRLLPNDPIEKYSERKGSIGPKEEPPAFFESSPGEYRIFPGGQRVSFSFRDETLSASMEYETAGKALRQILRVRNESEKEAEITDLSVFLPTNSTFVWEEDSGQKVVGHHFVGGNGSFSLLKRCDGKGPHILMLPDGDTGFEYWELKEGRFVRYEEVEGTLSNRYPETYTNLFIHSEKASARAREMGTRLRHAPTARRLTPGEEAVYAWKYVWVRDDEEARDALAENGSWDVRSVPGYTVPRNMRARLALRGKYEDVKPLAEYPQETEISYAGERGGYRLYDIAFSHLGENCIRLSYDGGRKWMTVEYFVTLPLEELLEKRASFLEKHQCHDPEKWYRGLLCEWDSEAQEEVTPDKHDKLNGWFIYAICSDDPGLSKPAFLSSKIAEQPVQSQVEAMDEYIEYFVWGGLQLRDDEEHPYGILGIPNWHVHRQGKDTGLGIALFAPSMNHIWRIYDYPHIILMYYNMYRVASDYSGIRTRLPALTYLERAYKTALALFTWPLALDGWSADSLGLYNECVIPDMINSLRENGKTEWAEELEGHWSRKARYFIMEMKDPFVSEIAIDTTNFETSYAVAKYALENASHTTAFQADDKDVFKRRNRMLLPKVMEYMQKQMQYNISCRGTIEPAYYWYGSDYRGRNSTYTLSYMSQMGGWALLDQALRYETDPYELLRLAYGSALSSWALMNCGDEESDYGYWFPGRENDGAAGGGFEPAPYGVTWLSVPHHRGCWPYSCEIDLGFSGGLRCMATVLAEDPIFGWTVYGGALLEEGKEEVLFDSREAVRRRLHLITDAGRLRVELSRGKIAAEAPICAKKDGSELFFTLDCSQVRGKDICLRTGPAGSAFCLYADGTAVKGSVASSGETEFRVPARSSRVEIRLVRKDAYYSSDTAVMQRCRSAEI